MQRVPSTYYESNIQLLKPYYTVGLPEYGQRVSRDSGQQLNHVRVVGRSVQAPRKFSQNVKPDLSNMQETLIFFVSHAK